MSQKLLRIKHIMRYQELKFSFSLDGYSSNHRFTPTVHFIEKLTDVIFVYFRNPHHNTAMLKKVIEVGYKTQDCIIFEQIGLGHFFWLKIDCNYFFQLLFSGVIPLD